MTTNELKKAVLQAKLGDKSSWDCLYNEFEKKIYELALKYVQDSQTAENIRSETFVTAMEKVSELNDDASFGSWLYTIAYHKSIDHLRDEKAIVRINEIDELDEPVMLPEDITENKETQEELRSIISSLKPDMRTAVIMYYFQQKNISDVAQELGLTNNAAKQKLFQARKKIRKGVEKLAGGGVLLAAIPMEAVLESVLSKEVIGASAAKISFGTAKIAAAAAAGVIAFTVPTVLFLNDNDRHHKNDSSSSTDSIYIKKNAIIPDVRYMDYDQAAQKLSDLGFKVIKHKNTVDLAAKKGEAAGTSPLGGTSYDINKSVTLYEALDSGMSDSYIDEMRGNVKQQEYSEEIFDGIFSYPAEQISFIPEYKQDENEKAKYDRIMIDFEILPELICDESDVKQYEPTLEYNDGTVTYPLGRGSILTFTGIEDTTWYIFYADGTPDSAKLFFTDIHTNEKLFYGSYYFNYGTKQILFVSAIDKNE